MSKTQLLLPFRYPGGKFYAIKHLRPFWESIEHDEYREPFAGGASVFFAKDLVEYNWINDIDSNLITTYRVLADKKMRGELISLVNNEIASKERWREVKDMIPKNKLEEAFRYYYLNRTSFSGKMSSPGWGYRPKRSLPPERWHERIISCGKKLERVKLSSVDFSEVITSPKKGARVLMYIDPPYYNPPKKKHYRNGFELEDHQRLCQILQDTEYKFFLSYEDDDELRQMYRWAEIYEIDFFYRVDNSNIQNGRRTKNKELVITNYKLPIQRNINDFEK